MARSPAERTQHAADALLAWIDARSEVTSLDQRPTGEPVERPLVERSAGRERRDAAASPAIAPAHTDWLFHHLRADGPVEVLAAFRRNAAGAGIIPWHLDLDRVEDDAFLRLAAPPGQARTLSLDGARMLAAELRDAVARRHALAVARVGRSQACCFDLHSLVPVPNDILLLGPDHPVALRWLWTHWGTTETLRRVTEAPDPSQDAAAAGFRVSFWSADWTPWRALATVQARYPALRFEVQPRYELT